MAVQSNFNKIVLLQDFAKYFNRRIFYYGSLSDYEDHANNYYVREDINFNDNDGIRTTLEALEYVEDSVGNLSKEFDMESIDYLLVVDPSDDGIISRWYVVDIVRTRNGLYNLKLKRDTVAEVISDNDFLVNSPVYVEKGHLQDSDPFIVNSENLTFNQIKRSEELLKESGVGGWVIGYMANDASGRYSSYKRDKVPANYVTMAQIAAATGIPEATLNSLDTTPVYFDQASGSDYKQFTRFDIEYKTNDFYVSVCYLPFNYNGIIESKVTSNSPHGGTGKDLFTIKIYTIGDEHAFDKNFAGNLQYEFDNNISGFRSNIQTIFSTGLGVSFFFNEQFNKLMEYNGSVVYKGGKYYRMNVKVIDGASYKGTVELPFGQNSYLDTAIRNVVQFYNDYGIETILHEGTGVYWIHCHASEIGIDLTPIPDYVFENSIPSSHNILQDAPYSMFAIPLNGMSYVDTDDTEHDIPIKDLEVLAVASSIATGLDAKLYDIQILPYCPCPEFFRNNDLTKVNLNDLKLDEDYTLIEYDDGDNVHTMGIIFFPVRSSFSLTIPKQITAKFSPKIESQVAFYRLCSPNYNGVFEFNLAKNGNIDYFLVDCTYKPFNPFIRVTPQFGFLYGQNFKDGRGLICGGDFSLAIIKDRWIEYELNNKNYAAIFARDIQNMEFKHGQEAFTAPIKAAAGTIGAGAAGAVAGAKVGGGYGAAIGAVVGTGLGATGGAIDVAMGSARRAEEKDYAIDRFNLQLGNIKALPQSLSRTSVLTVISKIFPFLEYYSCTDEEVAALEKKIRFDGMTVGRIGKVLDFMGGNNNQHYFKGQLIRAELFGRDEHFYNDLYEEIAKGVYI